MIRRLTLTALAATLALPAFAQGEIHVYNWSDYIAEDTVAKFEAATGIKVVYDVYDSNEVLEAKLLAGSSGYDVVVPTSQFLQRQIGAGVYQPLDKSKLPNLANMDPGLMEKAAAYDAGNEHAIIWMWGTTGIGYNVNAVAERLGRRRAGRQLGADLRPGERREAGGLRDQHARFLDRHAAERARLPRARSDELGAGGHGEGGGAAWRRSGPSSATSIRRSTSPTSRTARFCVAVGFSGDVFIAADRAVQAGTGVEIAYSVPKEGAQQWFDMAAIPADAPNPEGAHAFLNFVMDPQISADITNYVWYANANAASMPLVDPEIAGDPSIFPPEEVLAKLFPTVQHDARTDRLITRLWTSVKTGQ